jgi:hypothetical protein
MSFIPLKQTVTITPKSGSNGWGETSEGTPYTLKCRFQEGSKMVRSMANGTGIHGIQAEEVVSTAQIYFDKLATITLDDEIEFTDEYGNVKTYTPISIEIIRGLNGKAALTVVHV